MLNSLLHMAIIGGTIAQLGQFPATVFNTDTGCTAVKISKKVFLSAQHCFLKEEATHLRIQWDRKLVFPFEEAGEFKARLTIRKTSPAPHGADVYAMVVEEETPELLEAPVRFSAPSVGEMVYMNGYGCVDPKGMVEYKPEYFPFEQRYAEKLISHVDMSNIQVPGINSDGKTLGVGCRDDSGGPLYVKTKEGFQVIGIAHSSTGEAAPDAKTTYIRLDTEADPSLAGWVQELTAEDRDPLRCGIHEGPFRRLSPASATNTAAGFGQDDSSLVFPGECCKPREE